MTNEELKKKIVDILKEAMKPIEFGGDREHASEVHYPTEEEITDALITAGIGDVKEIKYRVRRAEKALYIACRETAEIIFKDDFDRHAQEYMYGYLIQAERKLAEEGKE